MKYFRLYGFWLILMVLCSCDDTTYRSSVPAFPVRMELNIWAEYPHFVQSNTLQYLVFQKPRYEGVDYVGYAGLLVHIGMDGAYHAYDLACPHCLSRDEVIEPDALFAVCPVCGEEYDLSYGLGVPVKGISKEALRQYTTRFDPQKGKLYITP